MRLNASQAEENHTSGEFDVDRLLVRCGFGEWEWILGRQALGLGRMTLLSPLDVIEPFSAVAVDTEVRPGVDGLRLTRYFGLGGQVGGIVVAGDVAANNSYLATFSHNLDGVDIFLMGGSLRERPMAGVGVAADVGGLGLKVEAAAYKGRDSEEHGRDLHSEFVIAGAESWYRFENGLSVRAQYLYNGAGTDSSGEYIAAAGAASAEEGLNSLLGQHYLLLEPSFELHPLVTLEGLAIWNMGDDSLFVRPMLDISVTDNVSMQVFWAVPLGEEPCSAAVPGMPSLSGSEFGTVNDYGGFNLTDYF